jgi:hypothetical protein
MERSLFIRLHTSCDVTREDKGAALSVWKARPTTPCTRYRGLK